MTNSSLYLVESADMYPDGPALRCDGVTTTFSELADNAARFAAYLGDRGLRPGDRVGVMLANSPEFPTACCMPERLWYQWIRWEAPTKSRSS
jgi:long-chain acyl-CoA synthetase